MRRHTALRGCIVERKDGVRSTTRFECTNLLEILALKKKRGSACLIQPRASQHKRVMDMRPNPLVGGKDRREIERHIYFDHPKKASMTPNVSINPCVKTQAQRFRPATM
jgi:hypothetical protein